MAISPANPATIADVTSRSFRTLSTEEISAATVLLDDAWVMLLESNVGDQVLIAYTSVDAEDDLIPVDPNFDRNVKRILAQSVLRVVNNPMGNLEEEGDDYRARRDVYTSSGRLYLSEDEIAELFPPEGSKNAFTIHPFNKNAGLRQPLPENAFWDPQGV